jgi:hypothetical protein
MVRVAVGGKMAESDFGALPPIRLVTRLLAEMQTSIVIAGLRAFDGDLDRFVVFTLIARQSTLGPIGRGNECENGRRSRAISINSLAASLSRPFETVRRHVNGLIAQDLVTRIAGGVVTLSAGLQRPEMVELATMAHDAFVRLVEDLQSFDLPMPAPRASVSYTPAVGVGAAADIMLAVADNNRGLHQEWMNLVLYSTILCANTRGFTYDPILARRYADQSRVPPDSLRRPLRVSVLARALCLPYATVQRRVERLVADGRVVKTRGGLLVSEEWLNLPSSVAVSTASYQNIRRILAATTVAGFPIADPGQAYVRGRPAPSTIWHVDRQDL